MKLLHVIEIGVVLSSTLASSQVQNPKDDTAEDHHDNVDKGVQAERNKDFGLSPSQIFLNGVSGGTRQNEYNGPPQPILLIGAGLPRTGTASFQKAMELLGLKCYHMLEAIKGKGQVALWHEHLVQKTVPFDNIMDSLARHGYNATVDMPTAYKYKEQMQLYPDAKVVLTLRSEEPGQAAQKWAQSMTSTILHIPPMARDIPFGWFPPIIRFVEFVEASYESVKLPFRELRHDDLPDYYTAWNKEVQKSVPSEHLLIFRAKDGWEPLCEFLSPLHDTVRDNCQTLLASKEPYPHVNDTELLQTFIPIFANITLVCKVMPGVLLVLAFILVAFRRMKSFASREKVE